MVTATQALNELELGNLSKELSTTNGQLQVFLKQISDSYVPLGPKLVGAT